MSQVRQELYYTPKWGERQNAMNLCYNAWGPPIPLMFFTFCLESCAHAALDVSIPATTVKTKYAIGPISCCTWLWKRLCAWWVDAAGIGRGRTRQIARMVYAIKLSGER